jgi:AcrR family transcriptional regulator
MSAHEGTEGRKADKKITNRHRPDIRRKMILKTAQSIIVSRGLTAVSIPEIAREADVSIGTVSYHFNGIDEILRETLALSLREFWSPVKAKLDKRQSALEGINILIDCNFTRAGKDLFSVWLDFWARGAHVPGFKQWSRQRFKWFEEVLATLIAEGVAQDEFSYTDATALARKISAFENGTLLLWLNFGEINRKTAQAMLRDFVARELNLKRRL